MKLLFSIFCFCFISSQSQAQTDIRFGQYDAKHYHIQIDSFSVAGKYMEAHCQINIKFLQANDSVILNLYALKVDSVLVNSNKVLFNQNTSKQEVYVKLPKTYLPNDSVKLDVFYSGNPKTISNSFGGFYFSGEYAYNMGVNIDANPASFGRAWFPCLDYFEDKTTYEFHVKIDSFYKVLCNGILENIDTLADGNLVWNWRFNQDISTYLASIAIAPYEILKSEYQNINGDKIPVYIAALAEDTNNAAKSFINLHKVLKIYEDAYGKYPFDRVGYDVVPFNGGAMEHAGNIAYPKFAVDGSLGFESLYAHELSHQWWGNWVTCKTPSDMWLNEGWASYNEFLMFEKIYDKELAKLNLINKLYSIIRTAQLRDGNAIAISKVPEQNTYGMHVYDKGATTVHTLRNYLGDDVFFDIIPKMLKNYAYKNWSTEEFQAEMEKYTGKSMDYFFKPWVENAGFTSISASILKIEKKGNIYEHSVKISQRLRWANELYKQIPIEITFKNKLSDSTIKFTINDWDTTQIISLPFAADYLWVDADEKISDAVTTEFLEKKSLGNFALTNANTSVRIKENLTDTIQILAQQIWASPFVNNAQSGIKRNANRYWSIQGNWTEANNEKLTFTFSYDATRPTNYNSGWLDTSWIFGSEDSIVLFYRPNTGAIWEIYNDVTYDKGNLKNNFGSVTLTTTKKGDYMFGIANHGLGLEKITTENLKLYPNPAKDKIQIEKIENYTNYFIYNINGILMQSGDLKLIKNIDIELLESGNYILGLTDKNDESHFAKFIIQK